MVEAYFKEKMNVGKYVEKILRKASEPNVGEGLPDLFNNTLRDIKKYKKKMELASSFNKLVKPLPFSKVDFITLFRKRKLLQAIEKTAMYFNLRDIGKNIRFESIFNRGIEFEYNAHIELSYKTRKIVMENLRFNSAREDIEALVNLTSQGHIDSEYADWVKENLKYAVNIIPYNIMTIEGFGKLIRVMVGTLFHALDTLPSYYNKLETTDYIFRALKAGYYYGLTYPLVDDILDSKKIISTKEKKEMTESIRQGLEGKEIDWLKISNHPIAEPLKKIFEGLTEIYPIKENKEIYHAILMLHEAQVEDNLRNIRNYYNAEEIYTSIILKSAYSRIVPGLLGGRKLTEAFYDKMMVWGIHNQLMDDLRDYSTDGKNNSFTPYVYYSTEHGKRIINPFNVYMASLELVMECFNYEQNAVELIMTRISQAIKTNVKKNPLGLEKFISDMNVRPDISSLMMEMARYQDFIIDPEGDLIEASNDLALQERIGQYMEGN